MYWDGENRENAEACSHNNPGMSAGCPETSSLIWSGEKWNWTGVRMRAIAGEKLVGDFSKEPAGVELYSHSGDTEADFDL
jgi:hypothetical protein